MTLRLWNSLIKCRNEKFPILLESIKEYYISEGLKSQLFLNNSDPNTYIGTGVSKQMSILTRDVFKEQLPDISFNLVHNLEGHYYLTLDHYLIIDPTYRTRLLYIGNIDNPNYYNTIFNKLPPIYIGDYRNLLFIEDRLKKI